MNLEGIIVLLVVVIIIVILLKVLLGVFVILPFANALSITSHSGEAGFIAYNIMMNVKINGHPVQAELDTGMDFTLIPQNYASSLGLNQLPVAGVMFISQVSQDQLRIVM